MKKLVSGGKCSALAAVLLAAVIGLSGCGGNASSSSGTASKTESVTSAAESTASKAESVTSAAESTVSKAESTASQAESTISEAESTASEAESTVSAAESTASDEEVVIPFPAFDVNDVYGNQVTDAVFADAKLTMLNIWGTFCSPCISEMPFLGELSEELANEGVQIVGVLCDVTDETGTVYEEQVEAAKEIVEQTGAAYTHLVPTGSLLELLYSVQVVPTTCFVDANGNLVGEAVVGSRSKEEWTALIRERLAMAG